MRSFFAAIQITAAIIAGSFIYTARMDRLSEEMLEKNKEIYSYVQGEDYENAALTIKGAREHLESHSVMLWATGDHSEIMQLEVNLGELFEYVKASERSDALAKCAEMEILLRHMPKNYKIRLENIL